MDQLYDYAGAITIAPDDADLTELAMMDVKLLKQILKPLINDIKLVRIASYPHKEGGNAILFADAESADTCHWYAVCPRTAFPIDANQTTLF